MGPKHLNGFVAYCSIEWHTHLQYWLVQSSARHCLLQRCCLNLIATSSQWPYPMSDDEETPRPPKRSRRGYKPSRNALTFDHDEAEAQLPVELFTTEKTLNRRGERVEWSQRFEPHESVSLPSQSPAKTPSTPANVACEPNNTFTPSSDHNSLDDSEGDDELPLDFGAFWGVRDSTVHVRKWRSVCCQSLMCTNRLVKTNFVPGSV